jgi:predicted nucleic acid-binding protein
MAGQIFRQYRQRGGKRDRVLADFLIAAHAKTRCSRLLTRDRGFYRSYFPKLTLIEPS